VIDPLSGTVRALASRDAWAPGLAFTAGILSGFGPCVAPRMLAVSALGAHRPPKDVAAIVAAFSGGIIAAYSSLMLGGALIWQVAKYSALVYAVIATVMALAGVLTLLRNCGCQGESGAQSARSLSSVFLLGASSVATISPCCMPVITAAAFYAGTDGVAFAWITSSAFALGHTVPLALAAAGARAFTFLLHGSLQTAAQVVAGTLALAMSGLFFVLA